MNNVTLIGRLGQDPETRTTNSGNAVMNLRVCTNRRVKKGDQWVDEPAWHTVVVFGKRAEALAKCNLTKGEMVGVEGTLEYRSYEKDGEKRTFAQILADDITLCGGKGSGPAVEHARGSGDAESFGDEDIPF